MADQRAKAEVGNRDPQFVALLESAAHLQRLVDRAAEALLRIDDYYADQHEEGEGVASQLVRQLSDPQPADRTVIDQLSSYRRLRRQWSDWSAVTKVLESVGARMVKP